KLTRRRIAVQELYYAGTNSAKKIAQKLKLPTSTCYKYVQQLRQWGELPEPVRTGRPLALTPRKVKLANRTVAKHPHASAREIRLKLQKKHKNLQVSDRTVRRTLEVKLDWKVGKQKRYHSSLKGTLRNA